ncbi:shikimate dehydrogenase [Chlorobium sp. N1]|uniref:shikimate dehydrogenase n=1 Tax=Chlorobium sp. N1 TaxID=2491138 RepID=UPI001038AF49|nr:shikimate dehydrogenase [Chlorobium sp. N1]TCD47653.1 shikimate dehydrogenase [Chlorobium sp. N1]
MNGAPQIYGLIGRDVGYSLSPLIHNTAFDLLRLEAVYTIFSIADPAQVPFALGGVRSLGISGCNVTIPYKETVVPFLDELSLDARSIGAVNTIVNDEGKLVGHNTDIAGFAAPLMARKAGIAGRPAVLFGSGGAALAAIEAMKRDFPPSRLTVFVRDPESAGARLERHISEGFLELALQEELDRGERGAVERCREATLLVNATPKGTHGRTDAHESIVPAGARAFHEGQTVYDMVYNPADTPLLISAREAGASTIPGIAMLLAQAARSFQLWTGLDMPTAEIEPVVLEELQRRRQQ